MNRTEAAKLVGILRLAFPAGWGASEETQRDKFALYCTQLLALPASLTARRVDELVKTVESQFPPPIAAILRPVEAEVSKRKMIAAAQAERKALADRSMDARVGNLLRSTIERLERKRDDELAKVG